MSLNITNQTASPALDGQDALVTMTWAVSNANIANLYVGQKCGVVSNGKLGTVSEIDTAGITVKCKPAQPNARFDSASTPGQLAVNETVTFF
jgi:hypothetical protein